MNQEPEVVEQTNEEQEENKGERGGDKPGVDSSSLIVVDGVTIDLSDFVTSNGERVDLTDIFLISVKSEDSVNLNVVGDEQRSTSVSCNEVDTLTKLPVIFVEDTDQEPQTSAFESFSSAKAEEVSAIKKQSIFVPGQEIIHKCLSSINLDNGLGYVPLSVISTFVDACHRSGLEIKKRYEVFQEHEIPKPDTTMIESADSEKMKDENLKYMEMERAMFEAVISEMQTEHGTDERIYEITHDLIYEMVDLVAPERTESPEIDQPQCDSSSLNTRLQEFRECLEQMKSTIFKSSNEANLLKHDSSDQFIHYYKLLEEEYKKMAQHLFPNDENKLHHRIHIDYVEDNVKKQQPRIVPKTAVLLKTEPISSKPDKYVKALEEALGFRSFLIPILDVEIKVVSELQKSLLAPNHFAGLIFSSARAVQAVKRNLECIDDDKQKQVLQMWSKKMNFAVFETTADLAKKELDIEMVKHDGKCMADLSKIIGVCENPDGYKPYLYPCSVLADKKNLEANESFDLKAVNCYAPVSHPDAPKLWKEMCHEIQGYPEFVVFFSPSGVESTIRMFQSIEPDVPLNIAVAIGSTTERKLRDCLISPIIVAKKPSPEGVVSAIQEYYIDLKMEDQKTAEQTDVEESGPDLTHLSETQVSRLQLQDLLKGSKFRQQTEQLQEQKSEDFIHELLTKDIKLEQISPPEQTVLFSELSGLELNESMQSTFKEAERDLLCDALRRLASCHSALWRRPHLQKVSQMACKSSDKLNSPCELGIEERTKNIDEEMNDPAKSETLRDEIHEKLEEC